MYQHNLNPIARLQGLLALLLVGALGSLPGCGQDNVGEGATTFKTLDGGGDVDEIDGGGADGARANDTGQPVDAGGVDVPPKVDVPKPDDVVEPDDVIGPKPCKGDGQCVGVPVGTCEAAVCAFGICVATAAAEGSACSDGDACTSDSVCSGGACQAGKAINCDDNNECTADSCLKESGCTHESNNGPCGGGDKCSGQGQCKAGKCLAGDVVTCDDKNACTNDACNPASGICSYKPNTKACSDGKPCTVGDACALGKCQPGKLTVCPTAKPCTKSACNGKTGSCQVLPAPGACDDGDSCTQGDTCKDGKCTAIDLGCDDGKACTDDKCDPAKGCVHVANIAPCSDAACNLGICKNLICWKSGKTGCDDNNPCTKDVCKDSKTCAHSPMGDGAVCGDGDACKGITACKAGKCIPGTKVDCGDGNACTDDKCDPKAGCSWTANTAPCNDGNKCTKTDVCEGGKCSGSGAPKCDDGNVCTADGCDKVKGCTHAALEGNPCDDGSSCTSGESCKGGKCAGATNKCDDGKPCTVDNCDAKGNCSWTGKTGACDDGNACTSNDVCKASNCVGVAGASCDDKNPCTTDSCDKAVGKCVHKPAASDKPLPCEDGDKCTAGETCQSGKCVSASGTKCDDANGCTVDKCDKKTGNCNFAPKSGPCDAGDLCTWGDACSNAKCVAGKNAQCDDGSPCTADICDAKTGKCSHKATAEGSKCSDGLACSTGDACKGGKCTPTKNTCSLYKHDFTCGQAAGWQFHNEGNNNVKWAVDNTPAIGALAKHGCTLNLNDGKDYCHSTQGEYCQVPSAWVESPIIDATGHNGKLRLRFHTYYDLDGPPGSGSATLDQPRIEIRSAGNQLLQTILLSKEAKGCDGGVCQKKLMVLQRDIDVAAGQKFRLRLRLHEPTNYDNKGAGWFVDNFDVMPGPAVESCDNKKDDDGDGKVDCQDLDCKGKPVCAEICTDGKDNDYDDKVDCADSDCASNVVCMKSLFATAFPCEDSNFVYAGAGKNKVSWAVDATPSSVKAHSGKCSLNFNNGTNYCGNANCGGNGNSTGGTATTKNAIDTKGYSKLKLNFWSNPWTETNSNFDRAWVQVSKDDFKGCIGGASASCSGQGSNCQTASTISMQLPKQGAAYHNWASLSLDVSKLAGSKVKIRYRFASCDGVQNKNPGWFIDDIALVGE